MQKRHDPSAVSGRLVARFYAELELVRKYLKYNRHFLRSRAALNPKSLVCSICGKIAGKTQDK